MCHGQLWRCISFPHSNTVIPLAPVKKLDGLENAPSAPLQREHQYPRMLMVLGLMEPRLKKRDFQSLKTPSYISPVKRLRLAVNEIQLSLFPV